MTRILFLEGNSVTPERVLINAARFEEHASYSFAVEAAHEIEGDTT